MKKKILVISTTGGYSYLKTSEECQPTTLANAERGGYKVASRDTPGVTEKLTERPYEDAEGARAAALASGFVALSYQKLASLTLAD